MVRTMIGRGRKLASALDGYGEVGTIDGARLGVWGRLLLRKYDVAIRNLDGRVRVLDMIPVPLANPQGWLDEESGLLLLADNEAEKIFIVDLGLDNLANTIQLDREPDIGIRHSMFFAINDDLLGCAYEGGVAAIGDGGVLVWHARHRDPGLFFRSVSDESIALERGWSAREDIGVIRIRIADGAFM